MEVMDTSLDKFYKLAFENSKPIPEPVLGKIAVAVSTFTFTLKQISCHQYYLEWYVKMILESNNKI